MAVSKASPERIEARKLARYYLIERIDPTLAHPARAFGGDLYAEVDALIDSTIDAAKRELREEVIGDLIRALGEAIDQQGEIADVVSSLVTSLRTVVTEASVGQASPAWRTAGPIREYRPPPKPKLPH